MNSSNSLRQSAGNYLRPQTAAIIWEPFSRVTANQLQLERFNLRMSIGVQFPMTDFKSQNAPHREPDEPTVECIEQQIANNAR
jgi:hypothetical protein